MPEFQAEILAKEQSDLYERLVTKESFEFTLKHELEITKTELKRDIKEMEQKLTIKLGALLIIGVTFMTVLDKLL